MAFSQTGNAARGRSSSVPPRSRHTTNVGALLDHEPKAPLRNHVRDNVRKMRENAKQLKANREEATKKAPAFKLQQFRNVPPRVSSRPSSAPARRNDNDNSFLSNASSKQSHRTSVGSPEKSVSSPGWRVSSGYGSLRDPPSRLSTPPSTPPRQVVRSPQVRASSTPVKPSRCRSAPRDRSSKKVPQTCDGGVAYGLGEDIGLDVAKFDQVAKNLQEMQFRRTPTKDGQGVTTQLQPRGSSMYGLLSHEQVDRSEVPAGYRLAPEEERLEMLEQLRAKLVDLNDRYDRLPLRLETDPQRQRQQDLRDKIAETEKAVQIFSRPKVFVEI